MTEAPYPTGEKHEPPSDASVQNHTESPRNPLLRPRTVLLIVILLAAVAGVAFLWSSAVEVARLDPLLDGLQSSDADVRAQAAEELREIDSPGALRRLLQKVGERPSDHRMRAAVSAALVEMGPPAVKPLLDALGKKRRTDALSGFFYREEKDKARRSARVFAAGILGCIRDPRAIDPLIEVMSGSEYGGQEAALALAMFGDEATGRVVARLSGASPLYASNAGIFFQGAGGKEAVEGLTLLLKHPKPRVRHDTLCILNELHVPDMADILIKSLEDTDADVRERALNLMDAAGDPRLEAAAIGALSDPAEVARCGAVRALDGVGTKTAKDALLTAALEDPSKSVRKNSILHLHGLPTGRHLEVLLTLLQNSNIDLRRRAAEALEYVTTYEAFQPLVAAIKDTDPDVRASVARAISHIRCLESLDVLLRAAGDQDSKVRYHALMGLGSYGDARAIEVLVTAATGEDKTVAERASQSLEHLKRRYPRSFEELLAEFDAASGHGRERAFGELARLEDIRATDIVTTALSDPDPQMRAEAYEYVPFYNRPESMRLLTAALSDESPRVRARAAYAIGMTGDTCAADALMTALHDEDASVRRDAVRALGSLAGPTASAAVRPVLEDPDEDVRLSAVHALGSIRDPGNLDVLLPLLSDPDPKIRLAAAKTLESIHDARAVGPLTKALHDPDPDVVTSALTALCSVFVRCRWLPLEDVDAVGAFITDESEYRRENALRILGRKKDPRALTYLLVALEKKEPGPRWDVINNAKIWYPGNERLARALRAAYPDSKGETRRMALHRIHSTEGYGAYQLLVDALDDPDENVRESARRILERL